MSLTIRKEEKKREHVTEELKIQFVYNFTRIYRKLGKSGHAYALNSNEQYKYFATFMGLL